MSAKQALEQRAERGVRRGADDVWLRAHSANRGVESKPGREWGGSTLWFRGAIVMCAVLLGALMFRSFALDQLWTAYTVGDESVGDAVDQDDPVDESDSTVSANPVSSPDRIVLDGMTLESVHAPFDPNFSIDDDFFDRGSADRLTFPEFQSSDGAVTVIFADADAPFENPIIGIELLDGGGFRPWGLNLGDQDLASLSGHLIRDESEWIPKAESGLVEVARIDETRGEPFRFGWQFDWDPTQASGPDSAGVQAEQHNGLGVWVWLARLADLPEDRGVQVTATEVLGNPGLILEDEAHPESDEVIWVSDDHVYRLTAAVAEGDTEFGRRASTMTERLRVVDDATWDSTVATATSRPPLQTGVEFLRFLLVLAWLPSALFFLIRGPRRLAIFAPLAILAWVSLGPNLLVEIAMAVTLAAVWRRWRHRWILRDDAALRADEALPGPAGHH